jgi:catechol 2,3-dioxygenase-like lactoylglutathione lyase family enzyme
MSHHYSGPDYGFPYGDARLDLTDLYAFPHPERAGKSILIMNVHPSLGVNPSVPTPDEPFAPGAIYEIKIDTDGDAIANIAYRVQFSSTEIGMQTAVLRRVEGSEAAETSDTGDVVLENAPVSVALKALVTESGDYRFFAGWRSDPFFFDTLGALKEFQFSGNDFFANADVCSIVLEVPDAALGTGKIGLWHRTLDKVDGKWVQADRGALPSQSIFLTGDQKGAYLLGDPASDARFLPVFAHSLEHTGGYVPQEARNVAATLLPDLLFYEPGRPAAYPNNGRTLTDDVMDVFISIVTQERVTRDNVGPHHDFMAAFPYLGPPHKARPAAQLTKVQDHEVGDTSPPAAAITMSFELVVIPVSDVNRAKQFYQNLGWSCDLDFSDGIDYQVVQFTPPGSRSSIIFGSHVTGAVPGSVQGLHLVVSDIEAARRTLVQRGIAVSGVFHDEGGVFHHTDFHHLTSGPYPQRKSYASYASFSDPDGNSWVLQEVTARLPPRDRADETHFTTQVIAEVHREMGV